MQQPTLLERVECFLASRGFVAGPARILLRNQLFFAGLVCLIALLTGWKYRQTVDFAAGVVLGIWNFYCLAGSVQKAVQYPYKAVQKQLGLFFFRLLITGGVLYALLLWAGAGIRALAGGLVAVSVSTLVSGLLAVQAQEKNK